MNHSHLVTFDTNQSYVLVVPLLKCKSASSELRIYVDPPTGSFIPTMQGICQSQLDKVCL